MIARISGIVHESIVDGTGIRAAIFFQGCPHACPGCHNPQTHDPNGGNEYDLYALMHEIIQNPLLDGITLTGGEPFFQSEAAAHLAKCAKENGLNVWTYTGYTFEEILHSGDSYWLDLLKNTDILVDGKFMKELRTLDMPFVGSKNQRLICVSQSLAAETIVLKHE